LTVPLSSSSTAKAAPTITGTPGGLTPRRPWFRIALAVAIVVGMLMAYTMLPLADWLGEVAHYLRGLGGWGVALYLAAYTAVSLFFFPAAILTITAGFAWGTFAGFAIAVPASTLASASAFILGRFVFSGRVRRMLLKRPKLAAIENAINSKGPRLVFLLRFSPVLPFPILNYILGMTRIPLLGFVAATFVGIMPISLMYTYIGDIGATLGGLNAGGEEVGSLKIILGVVGGLATIAISIWVGRAARAALREVEKETRPQVF